MEPAGNGHKRSDAGTALHGERRGLPDIMGFKSRSAGKDDRFPAEAPPTEPAGDPRSINWRCGQGINRRAGKWEALVDALR